MLLKLMPERTREHTLLLSPLSLRNSSVEHSDFVLLKIHFNENIQKFHTNGLHSPCEGPGDLFRSVGKQLVKL